MVKRLNTPRNGYHCLAEFVLKNGIQMESAPLPPKVSRGPMKMCFMNATRRALLGRGRFVYCEGYAVSIIPVMHGWCYDTETGKVVDVTWKEGCDYFGIPFKHSYVRHMMNKTETYGIIDQWMHDYPVLTDDRSLWLHPIAEQLRKAA